MPTNREQRGKFYDEEIRDVAAKKRKEKREAEEAAKKLRKEKAIAERKARAYKFNQYRDSMQKENNDHKIIQFPKNNENNKKIYKAKGKENNKLRKLLVTAGATLGIGTISTLAWINNNTTPKQSIAMGKQFMENIRENENLEVTEEEMEKIGTIIEKAHEYQDDKSAEEYIYENKDFIVDLYERLVQQEVADLYGIDAEGIELNVEHHMAGEPIDVTTIDLGEYNGEILESDMPKVLKEAVQDIVSFNNTRGKDISTKDVLKLLKASEEFTQQPLTLNEKGKIVVDKEESEVKKAELKLKEAEEKVSKNEDSKVKEANSHDER